MHPKSLFAGALLFAVAALIGTSPVRAQGIVDGFQFGIGLSMYGGDLDGNPNSDLPSYVGSSRLLVYAGADHEFGGRMSDLRFGLEVSFAQIKGSNALVDGKHSMLTTDALLSYRVFGPVALYAGVGASMISPSYARQTPNAVLDGWAVEGTHMKVMFPIGVILQDAVRIGFRLSPSDQIDGYVGGSSNDILGRLSVGYRFSSKK